MKPTATKMGACALVLALAAALTPAAAGKGATCDPGNFDVNVYAGTVDVNGALGTTHHYPVIQVVADFGDSTATQVYGYVDEWGKAGDLTFEYDDTDGLWKTEPLVNPTLGEDLTVRVDAYVGGGWIGTWQHSCTQWAPLVTA